MLCPAIANPASCKICVVIHLLHTKNMSDVEIHWELCAVVYVQNVMSEATLRQWYRMFTMKSEVVSRPSKVSDVLVQSVDQKICER
jgi:hypothetical protein